MKALASRVTQLESSKPGVAAAGSEVMPTRHSLSRRSGEPTEEASTVMGSEAAEATGAALVALATAKAAEGWSESKPRDRVAETVTQIELKIRLRKVSPCSSAYPLYPESVASSKG